MMKNGQRKDTHRESDNESVRNSLYNNDKLDNT